MLIRQHRCDMIQKILQLNIGNDTLLDRDSKLGLSDITIEGKDVDGNNAEGKTDISSFLSLREPEKPSWAAPGPKTAPNPYPVPKPPPADHSPPGRVSHAP